MEEQLENVEKTYTDKKTGKFVEGNPGGGRPKGSQSFSTLYRKAIEKVATSKGMTAEEFEVSLIEQAIEKGHGGDRGFYADTMDRVHGKAPQTVHQTVEATVNHLNELSDDELLNLTTGSESGTGS